MYTGKCDVDDIELVQFLSVGKYLGVTGLPYEMYDNAICELKNAGASILSIDIKHSMESKLYATTIEVLFYKNEF